MSHGSDRGHRRLLAPVTAAVLLAGGLGMVGVAAAGQQGPPPRVPLASGQEPASPAAGPSARGTAQPRQATAQPRQATAQPKQARPQPKQATARRGAPAEPAADPVRLRVPSIGVDTDLLDLALDRAGALEVPEDPDRAGWFAGGTAPGDPGAAVLAGHVDSRDGPAVFYLLSALRPGAEVLVDREDGTSVTFRVDRVARYPKDDLPTAQVYAASGTALRLVTCGGAFDEGTGHYRDNVVAYATLAG